MSDKNSQRKHRGLWAAVSGLAVCAAIGVGAQAPSATAAPVNVTSDVSSVAPESPGGASASDANPRLSNPAPRPRQLETNLLVPWVLGAFPGLWPYGSLTVIIDGRQWAASSAQMRDGAALETAVVLKVELFQVFVRFSSPDRLSGVAR